MAAPVSTDTAAQSSLPISASRTSPVGGEALSIVQMVETLVAEHALDARRVYVTGLSAGGALPFVGMAATAGKWGKRAVDSADAFADAHEALPWVALGWALYGLGRSLDAPRRRERRRGDLGERLKQIHDEAAVTLDGAQPQLQLLEQIVVVDVVAMGHGPHHPFEPHPLVPQQRGAVGLPPPRAVQSGEARDRLRHQLAADARHKTELLRRKGLAEAVPHLGHPPGVQPAPLSLAVPVDVDHRQRAWPARARRAELPPCVRPRKARRPRCSKARRNTSD